MIHIRPAQSNDSETLTDLAERSEAHWGYAADCMATFREVYRVTDAFIGRNTVFVAEVDGRVLGFYALVPEAEGVSLDYMYLDPSQLGRGFGRMLWEHMTAHCRTAGIPEIHLICGPELKAFYLKMGAVQTGEAESLVVPDRTVARLAYRIPAP